MAQLLLFNLSSKLFAIDINELEVILEKPTITHVPKASDLIVGIINYRGRIITVIDTVKLLDLPAAPQSEASKIVVPPEDEVYYGLLVQSVSDFVIIEDSNLKDVPTVSSSLTFEKSFISKVFERDNRIVSVLDVAKIREFLKNLSFA